jgi:hypothetical protein
MMAMRSYLSVVPGDGGAWRVRYPDATESLEFRDKSKAVSRAAAWALLHKPSEIWVFAEDGELADVLIYE